jgi:hypothetical protein
VIKLTIHSCAAQRVLVAHPATVADADEQLADRRRHLAAAAAIGDEVPQRCAAFSRI